MKDQSASRVGSSAPSLPSSSAPRTGFDDCFTIEGIESFTPFLVSIVSDEDHWLFTASNGGLTAGRESPERSLFPYYTQDKLIDLAPTTGPLTRLWVNRGEKGAALWKPFDPAQRTQPRRLSKKLDGTQITFEETAPALGLRFSYTWGFSRRLGFVRRCVLTHLGDKAVRIDLLDGFQNLQACGLSDEFQNSFSILVDAYKRVECVPGTHLRMIYLSSIPTDRAEPSESLRCNVAWSNGLDAAAHLVTTRQLEAFHDGTMPTDEAEARGQRAACLDYAQLTLAPGESRTWYTVAEVGQSTAQVTFLQKFLEENDAAARSRILEEELARTSINLQRKVGSADGLQCTADTRRKSRHFSNVMFNIMRGGIFLDNDYIPREPYLAHLKHFNRAVAERNANWTATLPERISREELDAAAAEQGDLELERLTSEYLPLTFSRRHGDPSRPWNRFAIQVRDAKGRPRLSYQGNWRDIFQNWETLMHSFPAFTEGAIFRFLNATTADGYNPYKLTHTGFDWETVDPDEPWSNIGYWGDHQIIYLLRLLETSRRFHPDHLEGLLERQVFSYARVPYRIAPYAEMVKDPRVSISYDDDAEADIAQRVEAIGADGKLLATADGSIVHVNLFEKLLSPLLAKLANFVPDGGIWMNTQRPEWNDANNALVGYGISVVTMAYCHRYIEFLLEWWESQPADRSIEVSVELAALLEAQATVFQSELPEGFLDAQARRKVLDRLGASVSTYRDTLYAAGLSGERSGLAIGDVKAYLLAARTALARSLRANRRDDGLYHSYNLLRFEASGGVNIAYLYEMLEGQVAILSARLLQPTEALEVVQALRQSSLYRADQDSYILYPDRDLPRFLEKNRIAPTEAARSKLLQALVADPDQMVVETDAAGDLRFAGHLRNGVELAEALAALPARFKPLVTAEGARLVAHLEDIFNHHAFTGRSGTFFAYEGLGSIYWHMVSKLVLAIQEHAIAIAENPAQSETADALAHAYEATLAGLGIHKSPADYGAFPTDAYSHTPKHAGAQQPGMTGQVKEDILIRWGEFGIGVVKGCLRFRPALLRAGELLKSPAPFSFFDLNGEVRSIDVPAQAIAFTFCQVPIVYRVGAEARITATLAKGQPVTVDGTELPAALSHELFNRTGQITLLEVELPAAWIRQEPT